MMFYSNQDLKCGICFAQEHSVSLEEMGIIGSEALFKALEVHQEHTRKEARKH